LRVIGSAVPLDPGRWRATCHLSGAGW